MADVIFFTLKDRRPELYEGKGEGLVCYTPHLGVASMAAVLMDNGYTVRAFDLQLEKEPKMKGLLLYERPKIVGIPTLTTTRFECFRIARKVKNISKDITVVVGGPHTNFTSEETLMNIPQIDIIVRGEGERTIVELADSIIKEKRPLDSIDGISYREKGRIIHNKQRARMTSQELDDLPLPARDIFPMDKYNYRLEFLNLPATSVMTSRGCLMGCVFCSATAMWGKKHTARSPKRVVDEIQMLKNKYGIRGLIFLDDTLNLNRHHIETLCDEMTARRLGLRWRCGINAFNVDRRLLEKMKRAGCYLTSLGVESGNEDILRSLHKGITLQKILDIINWNSELGIYTKTSFMMGHPSETYEQAMDTVRFMRKIRHKVEMAGIAACKIYPGTHVEKYAVANNLFPKDFSWSKRYCDPKNKDVAGNPLVPFLIQPQLGYEEFVRLRYEALYAHRGRLENVRIALKKIFAQKNPAKFARIGFTLLKRLRIRGSYGCKRVQA